MYSLFGYRQMAADPVRMDAYAAALRAAVRPGCTVLDIGAGTGVMSILAAKLGAGRVFAVEPDRALRLARENAAANGVADRIEFFEARSTDIDLPARADVVVSDLRGVLPLHQHHLPAITDARARHLAAGGVLIPRRDTVHAALVQAPEVYARYAPLTVHGVTLDAARRVTNHLWMKVQLGAEALLSEPARWATIDYATAESPNHRAALEWTLERAGDAHGLALWFDAELAEGIGYTGRPGAPERVYGHGFFPFPAPLPLAPGDRVRVDLRADLVADDYVWTWHTALVPLQGPPLTHRQTTLRGTMTTLAELKQSTPRI